VVSQRVNPGMVHDVPRAGEDHQHPGLGDHRHARRHPQLGDAHRAQAHAHDRRLRAVSYGFNYYGTIGTNRDEFVVVRKMDKVDWLDDEAPAGAHA
jgi:nitrate reductase alpha subunit